MAITPRPEWLKVRVHDNETSRGIAKLIEDKHLNTVCQEARCPNIFECWGVEKTATFMLMGDVCTRHCGFCAVTQGAGKPLDPEEPRHVAEAVKALGVAHAVVTSVNRDELPDGGAAHFAATIREIRALAPGVTIEVLIPDFLGSEAALGDRPRRAAGGPQPQHGDRRAPLPARAARRGLRAVAGASPPRREEERRREGKRQEDFFEGEERHHGRSRRIEGRAFRDPARPPILRRRGRDGGPVPPAARAPPPDRAVLHAAGVRGDQGRGREPGFSESGIRAAGEIELPRESGRSSRRSRSLRPGRSPSLPGTGLLPRESRPASSRTRSPCLPGG